MFYGFSKIREVVEVWCFFLRVLLGCSTGFLMVPVMKVRLCSTSRSVRSSGKIQQGEERDECPGACPEGKADEGGEGRDPK